MEFDGSDLESQEDYGGDYDSADEGNDAVWMDAEDDDGLDLDGDLQEESDNDEFEVNDNLREAENFTVLSGEIIRRRIDERIAEISTVLSVSKQDAIILLYRYEIGVLWLQKGIFCGICLEDYRVYDGQGIAVASCSHVFCRGCWERYVQFAINDGSGCLMLACPQPKCGAAVDKDMIEQLVSDADKAKYWNYIFRSFVENRKSGNIKWCPAPGCNFAVECEEGVVSSGRSLSVTCNCSYGFCWNCLEEAHSPADCEVVAQWILKISSEAENTKWILANSKPCPKCRRAIEKNHGCMHMTCRPPCRYHFCWLCFGPWSEHGEGTCGFYKCNTYEEGKLAGKYDEAEPQRQAAKSSVERYTHYFERWAANNSSRNIVIKDTKMTKTVNLAKIGSILGIGCGQ